MAVELDVARAHARCSNQRPPRLAEDDHVAAVGEHQLEVAAAQRLGGPPAVLDQPLLAHRLDRDAGRPPAARRPRRRRAPATGGAVEREVTAAAFTASSGNGVSIARRSGTREPGSTSSTRSTASRPAAARAWRTASASRPRRCARLVAPGASAARRPASPSSSAAQREAATAGRGERRRASGASASSSRSRSAVALRRSAPRPPAAAAGEPRLEPQRREASARGGAGWRAGARSAARARARAAGRRRPRAARAPRRSSLAGPARAQRLLAAARQPQRAQPGLAEAVGDRVARAARPARRASARRAAPACPRRLTPGPLVAQPVAKERRLGSAARNLRAARSGDDHRRAAGASERRRQAQRRVGPAPSRARLRPRRRRARSSARSGRPTAPRRPSRPKKASPGRRGLDRRADPLERRAATPPTPPRRAAGRAGPAPARGSAPSASPSRIPARTPNASAAPDASPITCAPPGSGASATGRASISRRPASAARSSKRGMRAQATIRTHVRTRVKTSDKPPRTNQAARQRYSEHVPALRSHPLYCCRYRDLRSCGGDEGLPDTPESDEPTADLEGPEEDVEVIRSWAEALTESDIEAAAEFFAIPSVAENGLSYDIETRGGRRVLQRVAPMRRHPGGDERRGRVHHRHLRADRPARPGALSGQWKPRPDELRDRGRSDRRMAPSGAAGRAGLGPNDVTRTLLNAQKPASSGSRSDRSGGTGKRNPCVSNQGELMHRLRLVSTAAAIVALSFGVAACGDDDDERQQRWNR